MCTLHIVHKLSSIIIRNAYIFSSSSSVSLLTLLLSSSFSNKNFDIFYKGPFDEEPNAEKRGSTKDRKILAQIAYEVKIFNIGTPHSCSLNTYVKFTKKIFVSCKNIIITAFVIIFFSFLRQQNQRDCKF